MGKHRWPTAGDEEAQSPSTSPSPPPDEHRSGAGWGGDTGRERQALRRIDLLPHAVPDPPSRAAGQDQDSPLRGGVRWGVARSAALVFLGVALAIGGALFLVRSSEPSAAAVSVQLEAESPSTKHPSSRAPQTPDAGGTDAGGTDAGDAGSAMGGPVPANEQQGGQQGDVDAAGDGSRGGMAGPEGGAGTIVVYVTGAVASPGVVTIPSGTRLFEVLERTGGALAEADLEGINLAATPSDGQHIHLLAVGEEPRADQGGSEAPVASPGQADTPGGTPGGSGPSTGANGTIDINTATLAEIESLPRVGPILGQRIIDWREEHGPFAQAADIDAVPGIGPAMLDGILPLIVVR